MIIRAYELKKGDLFIKQGSEYMVVRVTEKHIVYSGFSGEYESTCGHYGEIGVKSQERVQYIGAKPIRQVNKKLKQVYESSL